MVNNSGTRQSELLLNLVASVKTLGKSENGEGILPKERQQPGLTLRDQKGAGRGQAVLEKALAFLHKLNY